MKLFIFIFLIIVGIDTNAQIQYSSQIPKEERYVLEKFENELRRKPFTLPKVISSVTNYSREDSLFYSNIIKQFIDTLSVRSLINENDTAFEKNVSMINDVTLGSISGIHNMLQCLPDSLFFVMPANEYASLSKEEEVDSSQKDILVAGYSMGKYQYPMFSIEFSKDKKHFMYINMLLRFDAYSKDKKDYFNQKLAPLIAPCTRSFGKEYEIQQTKIEKQ
jgi:hypothetical protein